MEECHCTPPGMRSCVLAERRECDVWRVAVLGGGQARLRGCGRAHQMNRHFRDPPTPVLIAQKRSCIAFCRGPGRRFPMSIDWIRDADEALRRAAGSGKPLLLDFSAAPM